MPRISNHVPAQAEKHNMLSFLFQALANFIQQRIFVAFDLPPFFILGPRPGSPGGVA